ncbi:uncharacterized protein B0H18DRAFT_950731 [Fomitopsis serialis]|uniref:uncharacterized protein n=1 Tax=Fomitopsis serialis TaxID=139415 RepID=UPI0020078C02|nr:uncharacterized protein B0H18DRAFT_950731 [Neoantrodia serialis]KAH9936458.1 hypothetical protein B0H18DRAFT_950731 [Neoantrodia serialis]
MTVLVLGVAQKALPISLLCCLPCLNASDGKAGISMNSTIFNTFVILHSPLDPAHVLCDIVRYTVLGGSKSTSRSHADHGFETFSRQTHPSSASSRKAAQVREKEAALRELMRGAELEAHTSRNAPEAGASRKPKSSNRNTRQPTAVLRQAIATDAQSNFSSSNSPLSPKSKQERMFVSPDRCQAEEKSTPSALHAGTHGPRREVPLADDPLGNARDELSYLDTVITHRCLIFAPAFPLAFIRNPAASGEYQRLGREHSLQANSGLYALDPTKRENVVFIEHEAWLVTMVRDLAITCSYGDSDLDAQHLELQDRLHRELGRLDVVKEGEWKRQQVFASGRKTTVSSNSVDTCG